MKETATAVLVLGMHRSGTSSLTGVLGRFGVDLGPHLGSPMPDNPTGFYEHTDVVALHDDVLSLFGMAWDDPAPLPDGWERDPRIEPFRGRLRSIVERDFHASRLWGVKDPRLCRFVPLWLDVLAELRVEVKAIFVVRDPTAVSASLAKRNGIDAEQATLLWLSHVLASEMATRDVPRTVVAYDDLIADWQSELQRLRDVLALELFAFSEDIIASVDQFLDPELRHHESTAGPVPRAPQNAAARTVFEALMRWRRDGEPPVEACTRAAEELAYAARAAAPIVRYVRKRARAADETQRRAASEADVENRRLAILLELETRARIEADRAAEESAARESRLRAEFDERVRHSTSVEAELRASVAAALDGQRRAETYAEVEIQLRATALAAAAAQSARYERQIAELEMLLSGIQRSQSWRVTRPMRLLLNALRARLRGWRGRTDRGVAAPPA